MHSYLPAIGFSNLKKEEFDDVLAETIRMPDAYESCMDSENNEYSEIVLQINPYMGIAVRGSFDHEEKFLIDYYYPYFYGQTLSTSADLDIIKQSDKESYQGLCDEMRLGVNLIFFLQNMMEYLQKEEGKVFFHGSEHRNVYLSGLSLDGKILLPVATNVPVFVQKDKIDRPSLLAAAREGDEDAIESLTLDDMDIYAMISRRIENEDVYSIVKSTFMPYGIESDKYVIIGDITDVAVLQNHITSEEIYVLTLLVNDVSLDVCINKNNLLGEPKVGYRFKGTIWLQGNVEF